MITKNRAFLFSVIATFIATIIFLLINSIVSSIVGEISNPTFLPISPILVFLISYFVMIRKYGYRGKINVK